MAGEDSEKSARSEEQWSEYTRSVKDVVGEFPGAAGPRLASESSIGMMQIVPSNFLIGVMPLIGAAPS